MAVELVGREVVAGDMRKMKRPGKGGQSRSNTEGGREGGRQAVREEGRAGGRQEVRYQLSLPSVQGGLEE